MDTRLHRERAFDAEDTFAIEVSRKAPAVALGGRSLRWNQASVRDSQSFRDADGPSRAGGHLGSVRGIRRRRRNSSNGLVRQQRVYGLLYDGGRGERRARRQIHCVGLIEIAWDRIVMANVNRPLRNRQKRTQAQRQKCHRGDILCAHDSTFRPSAGAAQVE
jgi:hypothetical protein